MTRMGELKGGAKARVTRISDPQAQGRNAELPPIARRLMEMGFLPGSEIELLHEAPLSRDPIAVRVRGTIVAVRRQEANWIEVLPC